LIIVEGDHEKDDKNYLLKHKLGKIQQTPRHISKVMAINNLETLIPWSC
jgi:hypothetical protein